MILAVTIAAVLILTDIAALAVVTTALRERHQRGQAAAR